MPIPRTQADGNPVWKTAVARSGRVIGNRRNLAVDLSRAGLLRDAEIVLCLQVQPRLRIAAEVAGEPHRRIGGNTAPLANDVVDAWGGYMQGLR